MDRILEIEMRRERREVVGVVIHIVSVGGLAGASVTSPVMCDDAIAVIQEEHYLRVPVVPRKRPTVRENDRLAAAPILVVNLCAVFHCEHAHVFFSRRLLKPRSALRLRSNCKNAACGPKKLPAQVLPTKSFGWDSPKWIAVFI